jgi:hypothetical protein
VPSNFGFTVQCFKQGSGVNCKDVQSLSVLEIVLHQSAQTCIFSLNGQHECKAATTYEWDVLPDTQ